MTWHVNILTLFPDMFPGCLGLSLAGKALESKIWGYQCVNIRDFGQGVHRCVDDTPYGGGAGMVMRADILDQAFQSIKSPGRKIFLSPRGKSLDQGLVEELSQEQKDLTLLCGRYEGVDQRFLDAHEFEEISVGDYVLSGGEPAALTLLDACIRLLPGVMGNEETAPDESFSESRDGLLEYPHYTKPAYWQDSLGNTHKVPDILRSGNHAEIEKWRVEQSISLTKNMRPDIYEKYKRNHLRYKT